MKREGSFKLSLSDHNIVFIEYSQNILLGFQITYLRKQNDTFSYIYDGIKTVLNNISKSLIRDEYKVKVYSQYIVPDIRFKLTIYQLTNTNLTKLGAVSDRYGQGWLHMLQ